MFNYLFPTGFKKTAILFVSVLFISDVCAVQKPHAPQSIQDVRVVSAEEVINLVLTEPDLLIIDSRKKSEYLKGHIEGAVNILNTRLTREDLESIAIDKSRAILFYCNGARCLRSSDSINKAKSWDYHNLIWFRGGWKEWTEKRLPVITD